jgi:hypothetical protein
LCWSRLKRGRCGRHDQAISDAENIELRQQAIARATGSPAKRRLPPRPVIEVRKTSFPADCLTRVAPSRSTRSWRRAPIVFARTRENRLNRCKQKNSVGERNRRNPVDGSCEAIKANSC